MRKSLEESKEQGKRLKQVKPDVILADIDKKTRIETLAWEGLQTKLQPRPSICSRCHGKGEDRNNAECGMCQGTGAVLKEPDMRAIEMVLSPKFPKTAININAELDSKSTEDILDMIEGM